MSKHVLVIFSLLSVVWFCGCSSSETRSDNSASSESSSSNHSLSAQLKTSCAKFFKDLERQGVEAQSYYTHFIPEDTINRRYFLDFREKLERSLRQTGTNSDLYLHPAPETVFFVSKYIAEVDDKNFRNMQLPSPELVAQMANEAKNGTRQGWMLLTTTWQQFNRLSIGNKNFIDVLPDSVRSDLTKKLKYIVRVSVSLEDDSQITVKRHSITFELIEIAGGRPFYSNSYPLVLSYSLP